MAEVHEIPGDRVFTVAAVVGSLRAGSFNRTLLAAAQELAPPGMRIVEVPIRDLPLFDEDVERRGDPEAVVAFKEALDEADALLVISPEYNQSIPGVLKNAIDWASRRHHHRHVLAGKPAGIMGASSGRLATARMQVQLRAVLTHLGAVAMPKPEVMVANAPDLIDDEGRLTDARSREQIATFLVEFERWIGQVAGPA